jgi:hypothetical protein
VGWGPIYFVFLSIHAAALTVPQATSQGVILIPAIEMLGAEGPDDEGLFSYTADGRTIRTPVVRPDTVGDWNVTWTQEGAWWRGVCEPTHPVFHDPPADVPTAGGVREGPVAALSEEYPGMVRRHAGHIAASMASDPTEIARRISESAARLTLDRTRVPTYPVVYADLLRATLEQSRANAAAVEQIRTAAVAIGVTGFALREDFGLNTWYLSWSSWLMYVVLLTTLTGVLMTVVLSKFDRYYRPKMGGNALADIGILVVIAIVLCSLILVVRCLPRPRRRFPFYGTVDRVYGWFGWQPLRLREQAEEIADLTGASSVTVERSLAI